MDWFLYDNGRRHERVKEIAHQRTKIFTLNFEKGFPFAKILLLKYQSVEKCTFIKRFQGSFICFITNLKGKF